MRKISQYVMEQMDAFGPNLIINQPAVKAPKNSYPLDVTVRTDTKRILIEQIELKNVEYLTMLKEKINDLGEKNETTKKD